MSILSLRRCVTSVCKPQISSINQSRSFMNRPRNRQPRGQKQNQGTARPPPRRTAYPDHVPSIQQVIQGASVSIVLKQDQATGREVQGIVQDVLTRGNHPRGIKVRLSDGRVGRVQRMSRMSTDGMVSRQPEAESINQTQRNQANETNKTNQLYADGSSVPSEPPSRSLADFFPELPTATWTTHPLPKSSDAVICPVCHDFHGDEAAVSRHVDSHFEEQRR